MDKISMDKTNLILQDLWNEIISQSLCASPKLVCLSFYLYLPSCTFLTNIWKNILEHFISYKYFLQIFFNTTFLKIFLTNLFEQYISYTYPEISQNLETISPMGPKLEVEWLYIVPIFTFILFLENMN